MTKEPHISFRVDFGDGRRLGPGKIALLSAIENMGSISGAARKLGMSYRRAWMLVEECNALFESPLVEGAAGGAKGGGATLTATARQVIDDYARLQALFDAAAQESFEGLKIAPASTSVRQSRRT